ncbi:hypothetical protein AMAG_03979 [Allomyces macrogynus ATCC 38327]|uniref:Uncharacterized protein n=1 Tax=Allomyces macrogynus (strain ATCC 38327) TaxID=578462 RepID=A0A0L0S727_ALLM3|nr:hypothetical protein AMAG_03979 [Allomyces macrogynus ATCC 38327]|eukprot:KNE58403.1 hypothetical protein AMAG_03979 [Allomyces macrogynus ATCC 38327]
MSEVHWLVSSVAKSAAESLLAALGPIPRFLNQYFDLDRAFNVRGWLIFIVQYAWTDEKSGAKGWASYIRMLVEVPLLVMTAYIALILVRPVLDAIAETILAIVAPNWTAEAALAARPPPVAVATDASVQTDPEPAPVVVTASLSSPRIQDRDAASGTTDPAPANDEPAVGA